MLYKLTTYLFTGMGPSRQISGFYVWKDVDVEIAASLID